MTFGLFGTIYLGGVCVLAHRIHAVCRAESLLPLHARRVALAAGQRVQPFAVQPLFIGCHSLLIRHSPPSDPRLDAIFLLDLYLLSVTTFADPRSGEVVTRADLLRSRYLRSWCVS